MNNLTENSKKSIVDYIKSMGIIVTNKELLMSTLDNACVYDEDIAVEADEPLYVDNEKNVLFVDEPISADEILNSIGKRV